MDTFPPGSGRAGKGRIMASRIKGITVEIGGDTTKLDKALEGTNKYIFSTQKQLKDVEKLLRLDPRVCFKTIRVTKQGNRQGRQQHEKRVPSSHIWWQNGGCF